MTISRILKYVFLFLIILLFIKVDFRLETDVYCCSDDFDYYIHAETIALDFDLDYSNQLVGFEDARFFKNGISAPIGFIGSGFLASPFLFIGDLLDNYLFFNQFLNLKIYFYSFSSVFYLFLTTYYLIKIKNIILPTFRNLDLVVIFLGSGITYYAFERFSMTHVYEVFTITIVCYLVIKISKFHQDINLEFNLFLLVFFLFLSFHVRWVNYFVFFIPFYLPKLLGIKFSFLKYKLFSIYCLIFSALTYLINFKIYGLLTTNPNNIYRKGDLTTSFNIFFDIPHTIKSLFIILFGQEFGLFFFSPIIFFGLLALINNLFVNAKKLESYVIFGMFGQVFAIVILWQSTASSYGFRYLLCLVPLSLILFIKFYDSIENSKKLYLLRFVIFISLFSILSTLFFETTVLTQLSTSEEINAFGNKVRYTEPNYLKGYLLSFLDLQSYIKIFVTSFLGLIFFNLLFKYLSIEEFFEILSDFGLNFNNEKVNELLLQYQEIDIKYFILIILTVVGMSISFKKIINLDY